MSNKKISVDDFMNGLVRRNPGEVEFHQAVEEVAKDIIPYIEQIPEYLDSQVFERLTEPDRVIIFRVCWEDDQGNTRVNRGYRIQHSNSIGPYKGGLRYHPSVTLSVMKFLAFEQTFKNSLTGLQMGSAKGGANFNPKGKSDREVMRFCHSFMTELQRHIGEDTDVPAGDIGVGAREIGYLFGQYKRMSNEFSGVLTGKGISYGGSLIRTEATGYGAVYFMQNMLAHQKQSIEGKNCIVSGSGNVATYAAEKIQHLGGKVIAMSDSSGFIHDPDGIDSEKLDFIKHLKTVRREKISAYTDEYKAEYHAGKKPWHLPCDLAFPCATQNEIGGDEAKVLIKNGCKAISEGANMPSTPEAIDLYHEAGVYYAPGKAANAGGVAVSGLEMSQNASKLNWTEAILEENLKEIMVNIHTKCVEHGETENNYVNYMKGANIAGFKKVADAIIAYGII